MAGELLPNSGAMCRSVTFLLLSLAVVLSFAADTPTSAEEPIPAERQVTLITADSPTLVRAETVIATKKADQPWEKFEAEFGIQQENPSPILNTIEQAKYRLDSVAFGISYFLDTAEQALELEYRRGTVRRTRSFFDEPPLGHARRGAFDETRLKFDLNLTFGKPYVGARLVIPIGN